MSEPTVADIARFNQGIEPKVLLRRMGYTADSLYEDGKFIRVFCPIHKDQVRRSLVIDTEQRTFKCQFTRCPVHRGGMLVELYAAALELDVEQAVDRLKLGQDHLAEETLLEQAHTLIEASRLEEAYTVLQQARKLVPENTITRCKIASLLLELGRTEQGKKEYLGAAEDFAIKGDLAKTLSIYNLLVLLMPQSPQVRRQMAVLFARMGRRSEAAEHLKWIIEYHLSRQQISEAVETCEMLTELTPDDPILLGLHMDVLAQIGSIDQAVTQCEKAARIYLEMGEYQKARDLIQKGLDLAPHHGGLSNLRYYLRTQDFREDGLTTSAVDEEEETSAGEDEDEFSDWISSLEEEVDRPPVETARGNRPISVSDARVRLCRQQLEALDEAELISMEQNLRDMYQDVHRSYEQGDMEQEELRAVWEFYQAFCIAYDQVRRERRT